MPRLTVRLQPRRNWPTWASSVLITHPILWIWPRRTTTCSLDWKTFEMSQFFIWSGRRCCRGDLVGRTTFWIFFWVACKSYSNGLRSVLSFVGSMLNKFRVWSLISFLVGLRTYQHPCIILVALSWGVYLGVRIARLFIFVCSVWLVQWRWKCSCV